MDGVDGWLIVWMLADCVIVWRMVWMDGWMDGGVDE